MRKSLQTIGSEEASDLGTLESDAEAQSMESRQSRGGESPPGAGALEEGQRRESDGEEPLGRDFVKDSA